MKKEITLTDQELIIIGTTLGIYCYHKKVSPYKKDKTLPREFYRNRYNVNIKSDVYPVLVSLEENGLMERWMSGDLLFFGATKLGIKIFRKEFRKYVELI